MRKISITGDVLGKKIEPKFGPERPGDVKHSLANIEKARELIYYKAEVVVKEGLERILNRGY